MPAACDRFSVSLDVVIRPCRAEDLDALEWFGLFAPHHALIRRVYQQHRRGEAVMLVAQVNGATSGQLWIDLQRPTAGRVAEIWAVRVLPCLQGCGIGTRMVRAAEVLLCERGFRGAVLTVETDNPGARRLYERLGYAIGGTQLASHPPEAPQQERWTQWLLAKDLEPAAALSQEALP
jgi:ribosomal protein S18 acetylase RimI-like enzyme